ncbi:alpha/beta fold hydrolase [Streptomyces sp. NPDC004609]|uniref:alpha/beta fold hydrolase n=1 Tax=Streptomyces sp. NPDC004609 TaxID=3364704 RepID=UPI0036B88D02
MSLRSYSVSLADHTTVVTEYTDYTESEDGRGPAVLLVHSALLDQKMWSATAVGLAGYRVITYDLRGHGSARQASPMTGIEQLARDLGELADILELDTVDVVGVSLGGAVAQSFAADRPARVSSLALVATAVRFPADTMTTRAQTLELQGRAAVRDTTLRRWFRAGLLGDAEAEPVRYAREQLDHTTVEQWKAAWQALAAFDNTGAAAGMGIPVLGIAGDQDPSTPAEVVRELVEAYRHGTFTQLRDASHLIPLEQPGPLAEVLGSFLATVHSPLPRR